MNKEEKEELFAELVGFLESTEAVFEMDGPIMVTVKLTDNTYRKKTLNAGCYYLNSVYVGARDIIFVFETEEITLEDPDIAQVEVPGKDLDSVFPLFGASLKSWMLMSMVKDKPNRVMSINQEDAARPLISMVLNFAEDDKKTEEKSVDSSLLSNPMFGMF